jgi:hypothetical protein
MLIFAGPMADAFSSPGIDMPSPTLSARLRELADYLAAPAAGRLTEEQRALALGIARRFVADVAGRLDPRIDSTELWRDWLHRGLPGGEALAAACYIRAEEHRWREQSARCIVPPVAVDEAVTPAAKKNGAAEEPPPDVDRACLALRIADRRRFDGFGHPALAIADADPALFGAMLRDIAAWRLDRLNGDAAEAAQLGEAVRTATDRRAGEAGIDHAAANYHQALGAVAPAVAAKAIAAQDWATLIALAAAASRRSYGGMALALLTAESAALPSLLAPLRLDRAALAPLEASLAMLPARAVGDDGTEHSA